MSDRVLHERFSRRFRHIVAALPGFGWLVTVDGEFIYVSDALRELVGEAVTAAGTVPPDQFSRQLNVMPRHYPMIAQAWRESLATGVDLDVEHQICRRDGTDLWVRSTARPVRGAGGRIRYWLGVSVDIDRAMRTAESAKANEMQLRTMLDKVPTPIWATEESGRLRFSNKAHLDQSGVSLEALQAAHTGSLAGNISAYAHVEDAETIHASIAQSLAGGAPVDVNYRKRFADGTYRWVNNRAQVIRDGSDNIIGWYGILVDVDAEVQQQKELVDRETQLRQVVDTLPALIWTTDLAGLPVYYNRRFEAWTGSSVRSLAEEGRESLQGSSDLLVHPDDQEHVRATVEGALRYGHMWTQRFRLRRADGSYRWAEGRMAPLRDSDGTILRWYGLAVDIEKEIEAGEELRLAREDLARLARVASLAEMSASIAHEVSQPLAVLALNASSCFRWLSADPPNIERAKQSAENVYRDSSIATEIVERVRAMFQLRQGRMSSVSVNGLVADTCLISGREGIARRIPVVTELDSREPVATVDPLQIRQVLINLIRNAQEAMIAADARTSGIVVRTACSDGDIVISVEDCGPGVSDPQRIFESFYTTKQEGTGLGLAVCRSIISLHGGRIWAENTDSGARVSFTLRHQQDGD